jgi:ADP-ribose pyrophosphatase YjhB (NUDIX family)
MPKTLRARTLRDRAFQSFWRISRSVTLGVRAVVTDAEGRVLLVRHTYTPGWHLPGGGVERGHTAEQTVAKELWEETGVVPEGPMALLSVHSNHSFFPNDHVLVFRIGAWRQETPPERGEIAERGFFDPKAPPEGVTNGTVRRLEEVFGGVAARVEW